ncbi:MAG: saccharopine dehydrogenase family protein [Candidatus Neomarinimicrobiota bacterium]
MKKNIKNDLIVFGATGFTGKLVVEYLIKNYGLENQKFTWAIAGRDKEKLEELKQSLIGVDPQSVKIETYFADSFNSKSLDALTSSCRIIISTVGPYLKFGLPLVESCVKNHTNYCDLTGEVPFIRESIDLFHEKALNNKCRIIHSCGFDSIPSDLGVLLLQKDSQEKFNKVCDNVNLYVSSIKGGLSGGTIYSMINIKKYIHSHPEKRNVLKSPYSLNPIDKIKNNVRQPVLKSVRWDNTFNKWTSPFLMSGVNTRVVQRTNAIGEFTYGENFRYNELSSFKKGLNGFLKACTMLMILAFLQFAMGSNLLLWILKKTIFPKPGEGPSKGKMQSGFFKLKIIGSINEMQKSSVTVLGDSDPGYSATAKMLTESAISTLLNKKKIPKKYGVLTPASGIGLTLIERLKGKGIVFKVD